MLFRQPVGLIFAGHRRDHGVFVGWAFTVFPALGEILRGLTCAGIQVDNPVQDKIFAAAKAQKLFWLGINRNRVEESIKEGHMVGSGEETAAAGRKFTKREMPY
jgi:hypothetical protein